MRCNAWNGEREELMEKLRKVVTGFDEVEEERNVAWIHDAEMSLSQRSGEIVDSEVCAEVKADLAYAHTMQ